MRATGSILAAVVMAALAALVALAGPAMLGAGCGKEALAPPVADKPASLRQIPEPPGAPPAGSEAAVAAVVEGSNRFAFNLYAKLRAKKGNLVFSPYSVWTALAMTYAGARGQTWQQMYRGLHFPCHMYSTAIEPPAEGMLLLKAPWAEKRIHATIAAVVRDLNARGGQGAYELVVANRLWGQRGYRFLDPFLELNRTYYGAGLEQVDFARATEAARQTINAWVEDRTRDKIRGLLKVGILTPDVRLVLTNAIHFKGNWTRQFKKEQTADAPFSVSPAKRITVPMMRQTAKFGYAEAEGLQVLELPYVGDELSMVILLPKDTHGLAEIEATLDASALKGWLSRLRKRKVAVFLPRFRIEFGLDLKEALKPMGMRVAFDRDKADFSGMTDNPEGLYIGAVIHEACVDVNEEGAEAVAATAVVMKPGNGGGLPVFRADHPFLFLIRDGKTGSILFIGRVMNPME